MYCLRCKEYFEISVTKIIMIMLQNISWASVKKKNCEN